MILTEWKVWQNPYVVGQSRAPLQWRLLHRPPERALCLCLGRPALLAAGRTAGTSDPDDTKGPRPRHMGRPDPARGRPPTPMATSTCHYANAYVLSGTSGGLPPRRAPHPAAGAILDATRHRHSAGGLFRITPPPADAVANYITLQRWLGIEQRTWEPTPSLGQRIRPIGSIVQISIRDFSDRGHRRVIVSLPHHIRLVLSSPTSWTPTRSQRHPASTGRTP